MKTLKKLAVLSVVVCGALLASSADIVEAGHRGGGHRGGHHGRHWGGHHGHHGHHGGHWGGHHRRHWGHNHGGYFYGRPYGYYGGFRNGYGVYGSRRGVSIGTPYGYWSFSR